MLKLRFKRIGRKKLPSYKIIIIDSRKRRDGLPNAEIGFYNPITKKIKINSPLVLQKLQQGVQATKTMKSILRKSKILL